MRERLPAWVQDWLQTVLPIGEVLLVLLAAWLLQRLVRALVRRLDPGMDAAEAWLKRHGASLHRYGA